MAGYEGNGTHCKGKTTNTFIYIRTNQPLISNVTFSLTFQSWICAAGQMVDVQSLLPAQQSQQERGHVHVKRATLEMGSSAWVCSPDPCQVEYYMELFKISA